MKRKERKREKGSKKERRIRSEDKQNKKENDKEKIDIESMEIDKRIKESKQKRIVRKKRR